MRYQVPGIPTGLLGGLTAFAPHLTRPAASGAQIYKSGVIGQPGTQGIPVEQPQVPSPDEGDRAQMGTSRSTDAPNVIYPNLYYNAALTNAPNVGDGPRIAVYSDNLMPVPAVDPRGRPSLQARSVRWLHAQQIRQPAVVPVWADANE